MAESSAPLEEAIRLAAMLRPVIDSGVLLNGDPDDEDSEVEPNDGSISAWCHRFAPQGIEGWDTGTYRAVFFWGDWVLKVPLDRTSVHHSESEIRLLSRLSDEDARYFPDTRHLGNGIMLQARWNWSEHLYGIYEAEILAVAARLGIASIHSWQVGWRDESWRFIDFADTAPMSDDSLHASVAR